MWPYSTRSLLILIVLLLFVGFGTPLIADLFFELYHLTKIDALYSAYGPLRFVTAQYMFSGYRWIVTAFVGVLALAFLWFRQKRRISKAASA